MAKRGGKRPGAGRPAGKRDTATVQQKATIEELARDNAPLALNVLVQIATAGESEAARVASANSILDRGYGKPKQAIEATGKDGGPIQTEDVSLTEAARKIAFALRKAAEEG